jgi:YVTN family beta-propeller protein
MNLAHAGGIGSDVRSAVECQPEDFMRLASLSPIRLFAIPLGLIVTLAAISSTSCGGNSSMTAKLIPKQACAPSSKPNFAYVLNGGSSNRGDGTISSYTVNSCTGDLAPTTPATIATGSDPEDMVVDPLGRFAYVANLVSNAADDATISMYTINPSTGALTPTSPATVPTGFFPQGIGIDPSGKFVYTANSDDNTVSMFTISPTTGVLTPTTPPTVSTGVDPGSVTVDPSGRFAYVANQADDTVSMYTIDQNTGVLTPTQPATAQAGGGPFGVTVDPSGKFAYVPNAYGNNNVSEYTIDSTTGVLTPTAEIAASAGNSPTCAAVDPSGKFVYVVNRQDNTVWAYTIDSGSGNLSLIGTVATGVQPWRDTVDPSGSFLYVTNESGSISIYAISGDGTLSSAGTEETPSGAFAVTVVSAKQ